jgi:hypothetical protein
VLAAKRLPLTSKLASIQSTVDVTVKEIDAEIARTQSSVDAAERYIAAVELRDQQGARIKELTKQETDLTREYEELMHHLVLLDEFTRVKVAMVTDEINRHFEMARFRLFDVQINGAVVDCCDVMYDGVPWASLNTGGRLNVGLDIIDTMARALNVDPPPIWIDNAESTLNIRRTAGQQIRLIVRRGDLALRIVRDGEQDPGNAWEWEQARLGREIQTKWPALAQKALGESDSSRGGAYPADDPFADDAPGTPQPIYLELACDNTPATEEQMSLL